MPLNNQRILSSVVKFMNNALRADTEHLTCAHPNIRKEIHCKLSLEIIPAESFTGLGKSGVGCSGQQKTVPPLISPVGRTFPH